MQELDDLVAVTLLGTERRSPVIEAGAELGDLLAQLDAADPEGALLRAAAILFTYRRAGYVPQRDLRPLPPPAEPETLSVCSREIAWYLRVLLAQPQMYYDLLVECLPILAVKQRRVPFDLLPELIEWAHHSPKFIPLAAPVIGERGRWLIEQHPQWRRKAGQWAQPVSSEVSIDAQALWTIPPPDSVDPSIVHNLRDGKRLIWDRLALLQKRPGMWSADVVTAFADLAIELLKAHRDGASYLLDCVPHIPLSLVDSLTGRIRAGLGSERGDSTEQFLVILRIRRDMYRS